MIGLAHIISSLIWLSDLQYYMINEEILKVKIQQVKILWYSRRELPKCDFEQNYFKKHPEETK